MGCCVERRVNNSEDKLVCFEDAIGFNCLNMAQIDRLHHKYCQKRKISFAEFLNLCQELSVKENSLASEFLLMFFDKENENFNTQVLITLAILLGSGDLTEKAEILFRNYDEGNQGYLSLAQIRLMVNHILEIAIDKMCDYAYQKSSKSDKIHISEYKLELIKSKAITSYIYIENLTEDSQEVYLSEFKVKIFDKNNEALFSLHKIRTVGKEGAKLMMKLNNKAKKIVEKSLDSNTKLLRQLSIKVEKRNHRSELKRFKSTSDAKSD